MKCVLKVILSAGFFLTACAPEIKQRQFSHPKTDFKPHFEDVDLRAMHNISDDLKFKGILEFTGTYGHGSLYRFSENLITLGKTFDRPGLVNLGEKSFHKIAGKSDNKIQIENSTYVDFLISKSQEPVTTALNTTDADLEKDQRQIVDLVKDFNAVFALRASPTDIDSGIEFLKTYLVDLQHQIESKDLMPALKKGLQDELSKKVTYLDILRTRIQMVLTEGVDFPTMLSRLFELLEQEKISLPEDVLPMIEQAKSLADGLRACASPQDALRVIVDVWLLLDENDRKTYFQEISPALYKELNSSGKKTLACLRDDDCKNFFRNLKKDLFILPELKSFGVEKICHEIDVNAQIFVKNTLQTEITKILLATPATIPNEVHLAIGEQRKELQEITKDYPTFFKGQVSQWAVKENISSVSFMPNGRKAVSLVRQTLSYAESADQDRDIFESLGPSMAAGTAVKNEELKNSFEMVNRMARISNIVMSDKNVKGQALTNDFRNTSQAETVRGLSQLIRYFRDWETTDFDKTLGKVTAQDLVPHIDLGNMNQMLFPKADLYALSIATAAQYVENFESKNSPLFLMDFENGIRFLDSQEKNEPNEGDSECSTESESSSSAEGAIAGIVEIKNGKKETTVKTAHLARWIIALSDFYEAVQGAEKSSSIDLKTADACGKTPLDKIRQSQQTLRQLIMGLSNFLSNKMVDQRGFFASEYNLSTLSQDASKSISVLDQALAIRALVEVSVILGIESYRFTAIDTYYRMNLHLFYPKQRFYQNSKDDNRVQLPVVIETLRALSSISPFLPEKSANQLQWIMEPWLSGLEELKF